MKRLTTLLTGLLLPILFYGQDTFISMEQARDVAIKWYSGHMPAETVASYENSGVIESFTVTYEKQVCYYIFNISPGGFVAVSASRTTPPVLCYSFSGKYSDNDRPGNFNAWMEQYQRQIKFATESKASGSPETQSLWKYYLETPIASLKPFSGREILPMTRSTWDQGMYYNQQCPADGAGPAGHCVTGCVATALGQLMDYFRWPESGTGSYSYECPPYGTLNADFENANYEWDLMEPNLFRSNHEVAELLFHIGVSVDMVYGPDGSGMYNHKGAYTLKTYFKYSPETQYLFRDSTSMDWDSVIIAHLDRKVPMYYAGWSVPDTMGHAFICDGYQGDSYFHFNWGWGGWYDGYFYTDELSPGGNNFNLAQELIINAVPDTNLYTYPVYCEGDKSYTSLSGTIDDGSGPLYDYEDGGTCSWLITPDDSVVSIKLSFLSFSTDTNDVVTVYAGNDTSAPVIGTFSGSVLPADVTTGSNSMLVVFDRNSATTGDGFQAHFYTETPTYCHGLAVLTAESDTLSDGSGNWNYNNNAACLFKIQPPDAVTTTIYFTEFETEAGIDLLKIYDLQTQQLLAEYSGTYEAGVPDPVTSPSGKLFLVFSTDYTDNAPGWVAYYESSAVGMNEQAKRDSFLVFPNPADDHIMVSHSEGSPGKVIIRLTDIAGRMISCTEVNFGRENAVRISLQDLEPGIYILAMTETDRPTSYQKIMKR